MKNDRIRQGSTNASPLALELLADRARYQRIQEQAVKVVGAMYRPRLVPDLALKLAIGRASVAAPLSIWPDGQLAHLIYGGLDRKNCAPAMTHMQKGETTVSVTAASMLAQFFNYFTDDPVEMSGWPPEDRIAEIAGWIETNSGFDWSISAEDIAADPLAFLSKLQRALAASGTASSSPVSASVIHERLMETLYTPLAHATWERRLVIGDRRMSNQTREQYRFGRDQRVGTDPEKWTPTEIASPDWIIEYGISSRADADLRGWLVTVRDPTWVNIEGKKKFESDPPSEKLSEGNPQDEKLSDVWVWRQGWDRLIRWLPPFHIKAGDQIVAPTTNENTPDGMFPGLYRVFLFVERADGEEWVAKALWPQERPPNHIPDEFAYMRLCEILQREGLKDRVMVYAGSYFIPPKFT